MPVSNDASSTPRYVRIFKPTEPVSLTLLHDLRTAISEEKEEFTEHDKAEIVRVCNEIVELVM